MKVGNYLYGIINKCLSMTNYVHGLSRTNYVHGLSMANYVHGLSMTNYVHGLSMANYLYQIPTDSCSMGEYWKLKKTGERLLYTSI